ncbi:hypothetical protein Ddc_18957 [Ditylenchus destructor]|nr:hypothetical protein Ddc_18957 [Ditylenchus destructor]
MNKSLPYELLCSCFQYLDRKQLLVLSSTSQCTNSLIQREFASTAPYFMLQNLQYDSTLKISTLHCGTKNGTELGLHLRQDALLALLTKCKFIRVNYSFITCGPGINLDFLESVAHLWTNCNLTLNSDYIQPSHELFRLLSFSAGELVLEFRGCFSLLCQPFLQDLRYKHVRLCDMTYDPKQKFPYANKIVDFLLASNANSQKQLCISYRIPENSHRHYRGHRHEIVNEIKKRFLSATERVNFFFKWGLAHGGYPTKEIVLNSKTNQRLIYKFYTANYFILDSTLP